MFEPQAVLDPRALQIHTDGSAFRNPGHMSGCAAIARYPEHLNREDEELFALGYPKSTNQRMELLACVKALDWVRANGPWSGVTCVLIVTDSKYVNDNARRAAFWKRNGWRNSDGKPIFNEDLWDDLLKAWAKAGIRIQFVRVPGKKTEIEKRVDKLAKAAANQGGPNLDRGYRPGAFCRSMVKGGAAAQPYPARGEMATIRPYAKKPVLRKGEERISFNIFDEETRDYHSKFYAYTTLTLAYELHRAHGWKVQFNSEPKHPQIVAIIEEVPLPAPERSPKQELAASSVA